MKIGNQKDFAGGIMFFAIGVVFAVVAKGIKFGDSVLLAGYAMGTPARMGPAFFPFWLGVILMALGLLIAILGMRSQAAPSEETRFPKFHLRPILFVLGAVCLFGMILRPAGMLIAGILLVVVASLGNPDPVKWKPTIALAVGLVVFCAMVFVGGLKLPIPLCPDVEAILSTVPFCRA